MAASATTNLTGSLDATRTIPARLEKLDMSQPFFAALVGISKGEFSKLLSGQKPLSNPQTVRFYEMLTALENLVKFADPLPLAWREPTQVRNLLEAYDLLPDSEKKGVRNGLETLRGGLSALAQGIANQ